MPVLSEGGLSEARLERLLEVMAGYVERGVAPGIVTLVSRGGDEDVAVVGTTAVAGDEPMKRDTIFRIASLSKPITAVAAIGLVAFVGLVAPHAARSLVGRRHLRVIPVAALLGAILLVLADLLGRTVAAPTQLPAGLLAALVGAPYFFWLLHKSRRKV